MSTSDADLVDGQASASGVLDRYCKGPDAGNI